MEWWQMALIGAGAILLVLRLWLGPSGPARPRSPTSDIAAGDTEPKPWEAAALARHGTETTVADLVAQGRADELRGLGYRGDLPEP